MKSGRFNLTTGLIVAIVAIISAVNSKTNYIKMENGSSDKTTLFITWTPNPNEQEAMQAYVQGVMPHLLELGGKVIKRSQLTGAYYGEAPFPFFAVLDFPSRKALVEFFDSNTYQAFIPLRDKGFSKIQILFAEDL